MSSSGNQDLFYIQPEEERKKKKAKLYRADEEENVSSLCAPKFSNLWNYVMLQMAVKTSQN
jgi:hypothetical protein